MLQDKQAKEEGGEGGKSQNTGWTAGARPTGVQRDVASGAAGGFIGHQPVTRFPRSAISRQSFVVRLYMIKNSSNDYNSDEVSHHIYISIAKCIHVGGK